MLMLDEAVITIPVYTVSYSVFLGKKMPLG